MQAQSTTNPHWLQLEQVMQDLESGLNYEKAQELVKQALLLPGQRKFAYWFLCWPASGNDEGHPTKHIHEAEHLFGLSHNGPLDMPLPDQLTFPALDFNNGTAQGGEPLATPILQQFDPSLPTQQFMLTLRHPRLGYGALIWTDQLPEEAPALAWRMFLRTALRQLAEVHLVTYKPMQALLYSPMLMAELLDSLPLNVFVKDEEGRFVYMNEQTLQTLGREHTDVLGRRDQDIFDKPTARKLVVDDYKVRKTKRTLIKEEHVNVGADRKVLLSIKKIISDPLQEGRELLMGFSLDVTDKYRANQELQYQKEFLNNVVDTDPSLIFVKDRYGRFLFVNQAVAKIFGKTKEEIVNESNNKLHQHNDELAVFQAADQQVFESGQTVKLEESFTLADGSTKWYETTKAPLRRSNGEIHVLGISVDITQRKQDAEGLVQAQKAKEQFLANMSHEIRTPVNGIAGMLNLLRNTLLSKEQTEFLNATESSVETLRVIINDILDLTKIESGKLTFENIGFRPALLLSNLGETFGPQARNKGLDFSLQVNMPEEAIVLGDPVRVSQILQNLLSNAIKFTQRGFVRIKTGLTPQEGRKDLLFSFSITDSGPGIPKSKQSFIFEAFSQVDESITRRFGGTGLGLAICKQLTEMIGGQIKLESNEGIGTTFYVTLPFAAGTADDLINQTRTDLGMPSTSTIEYMPELQGMRILLVEDNDTNRLYARNIITKLGCHVDMAENGLTAVEKVKRTVYDLILMDIQMPVMDGYEATKTIRTQVQEPNASAPIVALTANAIKGDAERCKANGMNDYLSKPFRPEELRHILLSFSKHKGSAMANALNGSVGTAPNEIVMGSQAALKAVAEADVKTQKQVTDLSYLKDLCDGDPVFVREMVQSFLLNTPATLTQMNQALQAANWELLGHLAHKLKPTVDFMGMRDAKELIRVIERNSKNNVETTALPEKVASLTGLCKQAYTELEQSQNA